MTNPDQGPHQGYPPQQPPQGYPPQQPYQGYPPQQPPQGYPPQQPPQGYPPQQPPQGHPPQQPYQGYPPQQPYQGQPPTDQHQQPQQKRANRGLIITFVVVLVLALGTGGTWLALHLSSGGADSPDEAVQNLATSLDEGDVAGLMESLAPGEAAIFTEWNQQFFEEYQRLGIFEEGADPDAFAGLDIQAEDLTFAESQEINENLAIAKLTGGTLTVDIDPDQMPVSEEYREAMLAGMGIGLEGPFGMPGMPGGPGMPGMPGGPGMPDMPGTPDTPGGPGMPDIPDIDAPDIPDIPEIDVPEIDVPEIDVPEVDVPGMSNLLPANVMQAGAGDVENVHETIDIAELVDRTGEPLRIATVKVDGSWYPSLLHTAADYVLHEVGLPWPAERIPDNGAESAEDALQQALQAFLDSDLARLIELLPPDEMAVLHDLGPLLVDHVPGGPSGIEVTRLEAESSDNGDATRVTPTLIELEIPGEGTTTVTKDGSCYAVDTPQESEKFCADELPELIDEHAVPSFPPEIKQTFVDVGTRVMEEGLSVITTEVDGKHYFSPLRTFGELGMTVFRNIEPEELDMLLEAAE